MTPKSSLRPLARPIPKSKTTLRFQITELRGGTSCETKTITRNTPFERSSKRRKGYPSETKVKRGSQVVHGEKELMEKLGRNDLCTCGSGRRFQALLSPHREV
jgi:SEC-C motif